MDAEDLELDSTDLCQAVDLEADIDPDHLEAVCDATGTQPNASELSMNPSSATVADVPMQVSISGRIAAQKTDDFCQTIFATMDPARSFSFKGKDGVVPPSFVDYGARTDRGPRNASYSPASPCK